MRKHNTTKSFLVIASVAVSFAFGAMYGWPNYRVWQQDLSGQARLAEARHSRQIAVEEAQAAKESAVLLADALKSRATGQADAEVERAKGTAKAIEEIGTKLRDYPEYRNFRWVEGLNDGSSEVIYVATELGIPILEAGKRARLPDAGK